MLTRTLKKAWYEVPRIVMNNDKPEVFIDNVDTWFPNVGKRRTQSPISSRKTK